MKQLHTILVLGTLLQTAYAKDGLRIVVTPNSYRTPVVSCSIQPETQPPRIENDVMKFKGVINGYMGPISWRIPIYQGMNGETEVAVNRIGSLTPNEDGSFPIELFADDVIKASAKQKLYLEVRAQSGEVAFCDTSLEAPRRATASLPTKELSMINGSIGE